MSQIQDEDERIEVSISSKATKKRGNKVNRIDIRICYYFKK